MYLVREFGKAGKNLFRSNTNTNNVVSKEITLFKVKNNQLGRPIHFREQQIVTYEKKVNELNRPIHFRNQIIEIVKKEVNELEKPIHFRNSISREDFIKVFKTN